MSLYKPLRYDLQTNCEILMTCAKLHNLCIDDWIEHDRKSANDYDFQQSFEGEVDELGSNYENYDALLNPCPNTVLSRACHGSEKRRLVAENIIRSGFKKVIGTKFAHL